MYGMFYYSKHSLSCYIFAVKLRGYSLLLNRQLVKAANWFLRGLTTFSTPHTKKKETNKLGNNALY